MPPPVPSLRIHPSRQPMASDHILSATFPPPPVREGDDSLDSMDPRYRPFLPLSPPYSPFPRLRPTRFLPSRCLEQWFADGETLCGEAELGGEEKLDATWLWVNGSDERWRERACCNGASRKASIPRASLSVCQAKRPELISIREQNEVVHPMRSVLDALQGARPLANLSSHHRGLPVQHIR